MALLDSSETFDRALREEAMAAAARWAARTPIRNARDEAVADGRPTDSDSRERGALRVNKLIDDVRRTAAGSPITNSRLRALVDRPGPVMAVEVTDAMVNEVVVGAANFLSVEFLERGQVAARPVGRILIETPAGLRGARHRLPDRRGAAADQPPCAHRR